MDALGKDAPWGDAVTAAPFSVPCAECGCAGAPPHSRQMQDAGLIDCMLLCMVTEFSPYCRFRFAWPTTVASCILWTLVVDMPPHSAASTSRLVLFGTSLLLRRDASCVLSGRGVVMLL